MRQLIYFGAKWCQGCQASEPFVNQLQRSKTIDVAKLDADYDSSWVEQYNITNIPTFILLENNSEIRRHIGKLNFEQLNQFINA